MGGEIGQLSLRRKWADQAGQKIQAIRHQSPTSPNGIAPVRIANRSSQVCLRGALFKSVNSPTKRTHSFLLSERGRGGQDSIASKANTTTSTAAGKSACCGIFLKNGTLLHHESDFYRKAQAFFVCFPVRAGSSQSWVPAKTEADRKRTLLAPATKGRMNAVT